MSRFDELRAERPWLGFAVYAIEPGGPVTLEVHADGQVYAVRAETEDAALTLMFPPEPELPAAAESAFD